MPKLPNAHGARSTARRSLQLVQPATTEATTLGNDLFRAGVQIRDAEHRAQEKADAFKYAEAKSALLAKQQDVIDGLDDDDFETYAQRYDESLGEAISELEVGEGDRALFDLEAQDISRRGRARIMARAQDREKDFALKSLDDQLNSNRQTAITADTEEGKEAALNATREAIEAARERGYISAEQAGNISRQAAVDYTVASIEILPPQERMDLLQSDAKRLEVIPADQRALLLQRAQLDRLAEVKAEEDARSEALAGAASDLEIAVSRGQAAYPEIEAAFEAGVITAAKRTQLTKNADARIQASADETLAYARLANALSGGPPLDPKDKHNQDAVDRMVMASVENYAALDGGERDALTNVIVQTGIIPDSLRSHVRANLRGEGAVEAADFLGRIEEAAPQVVQDLPRDERAFAKLLNDSIRAGMDPERAVEATRKRVFERTVTDEENRAQRFDKSFKGDNDNFLEDEVDSRSSFIFEPDIPIALQAENDLLVQQYFELTDDIEASRALAANDLFSVWGETEINGEKQLMKYAPEVVYGLPPEEIERQISEDFFGASPIIWFDEETARNQTYTVVVPREDGLHEVIRNEDGNILRWKPDTEAYRKQLEEEDERFMGMARKAVELRPWVEELKEQFPVEHHAVD